MMSCHPLISTPTTTAAAMAVAMTSESSCRMRLVLKMIVVGRRKYSRRCGCFVEASSLGPLLASAGSSSHAAVASTIKQVAVSAVAIASGACLSTKFHFLWPQSLHLPSPLVVDGVDVTGYPIFNDPKVEKAISFARKAHHGQFRKTGEPYLSHCLHTARTLAVLLPSTGLRAVDTVVAGILHDVVDDTTEPLATIRECFGNDVANLVAGVSRLSYINQLLRRHRRITTNQPTLSYEEANNLRVMMLGMVDDPRVVLIKLADRLHNMRTIYALPLSKAQAVAEETLAVWCSLASRLGLWALKAELEDLCFAVLQPHVFREMRADLASMWSPCRRIESHRRVSSNSSLLSSSHAHAATKFTGSVSTVTVEDEDVDMKDLLEAVIPFELLLDRGKRMNFLSNTMCYSKIPKRKVIRDAQIALASLATCEEALERELLISTSYVPGMEVTLCSRLKSLYSIYSKMKRKDIGISQVYDARALRVVVGDKDGTLHGPAVRCCYNILDIVHRLWLPIDGEFDDYIVNPKRSGYQSLHTAVQGPDNSSLEVQIRTQGMHENAEHGLAAHWLYKETSNSISALNLGDSDETKHTEFAQGFEVQNIIENDRYFKYSSLKAGRPALRVEGSNLLTAVITSVHKDGKELLVAVSFGLTASEAVARRGTSFQIERWEAYARLYKKVFDEGWFEPGHGDWCTCLEKYTLCRDGLYHKQDQFDRLLPTFIQVIDLAEEEESKYWAVVSAVFDGNDVESITACWGGAKTPVYSSSFVPTSEVNINNKVRLLRTMLQWEEQICSEVGVKQGLSGARKAHDSLILGEVAIVYWPDGDIVRLGAGSTAADAARRVGLEGNLVLVNGNLVQPNIELKDGDVVQVRL